MHWQELQNFRLVGGTVLSETEYEPYLLKNTDWLTVKFLLIDTFNDYIDRQLKNKLE